MNIINFQNLAKNSLPVRQAGLRKKALLIAEAGYEAIDIEKIIEKRLKIRDKRLEIGTLGGRKKYRIELNKFNRIFLVGIGKGSALASVTLAKILGKRLAGGVALDVDIPNSQLPTPNFQLLKGAHPLPSKKNIKVTQEIIKLAKNLKKDDLLITFICGGGSALLCGSEKELKYSQTIFKKLTEAGANILELNTVRKHLSDVKGGNLAKLAYPATVISLIVSDVLGNNLSMVASGPTVYDKTTQKDAVKVLKKYLPRSSAHSSVLVHDLMETPKDKKYFRKVKNILFLSNRESVLAMAEKAKALGFKPKVYSLKIKGEARKVFLPIIKKIRSGEAILAGGETTVTLRNQESGIRNYGKGGRNMESVLGAISFFPNLYFLIHDSVIVSFASDGHDNTEAAGAIGDVLTLKKAKKLKLNPQKFLNNHNSFHFFAKTGDLIYTKKRSFNVSDLMLVAKERR